MDKRYNPNGVRAGLKVRVFTGQRGYDFHAFVTKVVVKESQKKAIVFLDHSIEGKPLFADAADCYPLRTDALYPGHHNNG